MARASEPAALRGRPRPGGWRRGMPHSQTAYVAIAFAVLIVVIALLAPVFLTPRNLLNISKNFSFIALMSLGETLVIITGGIDLSVGSVCALSAVVTMMLMRLLSATAAAQVPGATIALATLLALALAALIGLVNGLLIAGWLGAAPANLATGYELRVIAAAVIGGANLAGGVGGAAGAVIGAALIEVIRNGFVLIGANTYWEEVFVGVIIIIAVLVDQLRTRRVF